MSALDSKVADVLDRARPTHGDDEDEDEADLIAELENDDTYSALREKRLEQLHAELSRAKALKTGSQGAHGSYQEILAEEPLMHLTTSTPLCVVHFTKPEFPRCRVMDEKLTVLAEKHFDTRFVRIHVDHAPFLVVKLRVQVLPCVISFVNGVSVDRIVGFEGIGRKPDSFTVSELEARLLGCGVLVRAKMNAHDDRRRVQMEEREREEEYDDDDDW